MKKSVGRPRKLVAGKIPLSEIKKETTRQNW